MNTGAKLVIYFENAKEIKKKQKKSRFVLHFTRLFVSLQP